MSLVQSKEHLGLPIPDTDEYAMLRLVTFECIDEHDLSVEDITDMVKEMRPAIDDIIEHDKQVFLNEEVDEEMLRPQIDKFMSGVDSGYEFMIGALTYMYFLRSDYTTIEPYLANMPKNCYDLPLRKNSQTQRVKTCREGLAIFNPAFSDRFHDSSEFAWNDAANYLQEAGNLDSLIDEERQLILDGAEDDDTTDIVTYYVDGFDHGTTNAIEMYIQSRTQGILNKLQA